jgi:hypothetical protein
MGYKDFFAIIGGLFLICMFVFLIKRNRLKGALLSAFILVTAVIRVFGDRYGYDGDIIALIFAGIVVCGYIFLRKYLKN